MLLGSVASLVGAGVPLVHALRTAGATCSGPLQEAMGHVEAQVREGEPFSRALAKEDGLFSSVTLGLVQAGERGVGLATGLTHAARDLERGADTAGRVRAALAYPAVLLSVGTVSFAVIILIVVPRFVALLGESPAALPSSTRLLLGMSALVRIHTLALLVGVTVAGGAIAAFAVKQRTRWHEWLLHAPFIGLIRHGLASARAARTLGALLDSGTPALAALRIAAQSVGDAAVASRLERAAERVAQGAPLSASLAAEHALTPIALQLAAVGDGIGGVSGLLLRAADLEDQVAERRLRTAVALIEPAVVIAFAAAVAFVASALLQAIYGIRPAAL